MKSTKSRPTRKSGGAKRRPTEEDRRQRQLRRLGTLHPVCVGCNETVPAVLEKHHIAGRAHHKDLAIVCRNCHGKLSDQQRDHHLEGRLPSKVEYAKLEHYHLGLADLLERIAATLRKLGTPKTQPPAA